MTTLVTRLLGPFLALLLSLYAVPAVAAPTPAPEAGAPGAGRAIATRADVPWDQVGAGWTLASVAHGRRTRGGYIDARQRTLELISPEGTRHELYRSRIVLQPKGWQSGDFYLSDVDPARRTALLLATVSARRQGATEVDLVTGATRRLRLPFNAGGVGMRPDGTGVLVQTVQGNVLSMGWTGGRTVLARDIEGGLITSADGSALVGSTRDALRVVTFDGSAGSTVGAPGDCRPLRWYDADALLASCSSRRGTRLTALGMDGTVTPVAGLRRTTSRGFRGPSWDDTEVRVVGGRTYYEGNGPCGGSFITTERADGSVKMVRVPGSTGGVSLLDAVGERLRVAHTATCDTGQPRSVLALFDPVTKDEEVLVALGRRQAWSQVRTWDERRPWGF
ncbi:hypothetical protein [Nocardioides sp. Soil805]|uniref:hypothetical protein n=1 Tax=Nocardioides sp. Soil805 TaxID=1736416 RepID=UPI0007025AB1|nr:hypothetical protein [Nocardioides sp. Soil805]KRF36645.1 hypothetical protein ASG94_04250 [Nocardioides sp. Soil805]